MAKLLTPEKHEAFGTNVYDFIADICKRNDVEVVDIYAHCGYPQQITFSLFNEEYLINISDFTISSSLSYAFYEQTIVRDGVTINIHIWKER